MKHFYYLASATYRSFELLLLLFTVYNKLLIFFYSIIVTLFLLLRIDSRARSNETSSSHSHTRTNVGRDVCLMRQWIIILYYNGAGGGGGRGKENGRYTVSLPEVSSINCGSARGRQLIG